MGKILVTGGTGNVGGHLVRLLHDAHLDFAVFVRDALKAKELNAQGIQTIAGDFADRKSLRHAMQGIETLFLLTPPTPETVEWQTSAIEVAMREEVFQIVKVSVVGVGLDVDIALVKWHAQTEQTLQSSGIDYTIIRPHSFMQNWLASARAVQNGQLFGTTGDAGIPFVDARDVADAAFHALTEEGHAEQIFMITGPEAIAMPEVAVALSQAAGHAVDYINVPYEAGREAMVNAGLPGWLADDLTAFNKLWASGIDSAPTPDYRELTGKPGRSATDFAKDHAGAFTKSSAP